MKQTHKPRIHRPSTPMRSIATHAIWLLLAAHTAMGAVLAAENNTNDTSALADSEVNEPDNQEPDYSGWSLNIDNDLFTGGDQDRDYTGGIAFAISGARTREWPVSLDKARGFLNRITRFDELYKSEHQLTQHSIEFGFALFTPSDITIAEPIPNDHPYASLFFIASSAQRVVPERKLSFQSVLTIGALGLPLGEAVQSSIHNAIGSEQPEGWNNQISEGGELTARYTLGVQKTLIEGGGPGLSTQFSISSEASVGFTTDASVGFGVRWGRLERPWYTFNPHPAEYISVGSPPGASNALTSRREFYLYAGATVKYRLYNAILQGQFRDSVISFDYDDLNPTIIEGWGGFLTEVAAGYRFGMFIRGRSAEINKSIGRNPVWGGILISRSL